MELSILQKNSTLISGVAICLFSGNLAMAQVIPDNTLPKNSQVTPNCFICEVTGGTVQGNNLFHSFEQFSIPTNGVADFRHIPTIQNIFARVTGQQNSNINGILQTSISDISPGNANLFLINPNGIFFGRNASLNIGGSFLATTAESIFFSDNLQFNAITPQSSLLSINSPVGLQFGQRSGEITNSSRGGVNGSRNSLDEPVGLEVTPGQNLALVARKVALENGNLTARGGRIELGSIRPRSLVGLVPDENSYRLEYVENQASFGNLEILNLSIVDSSGIDIKENEARSGQNEQGGTVQLRGQNVILSSSEIVSTTYGGIGGTVYVQSVQSLRLRNGALIGSSVTGEGQRAGDLRIYAGKTILLSAREEDSRIIGEEMQFAPSRFFSGVVSGNGRAGDISVEANRLIIKEGSRISAPINSGGIGGQIFVNAGRVLINGFNEDSVDGFEPGTLPSSIISQISNRSGEGSTDSSSMGRTDLFSGGESGRIKINTDTILLTNGSGISTATFSSGNGGNITVNASESIRLQGSSTQVSRNQFRSAIGVSAEPDATGNVGELEITTPQLLVDDRAEISANNRGTGDPGRAIINAQSLVVRNGGEIRAGSIIPDTDASDRSVDLGDGGTLTINADRILLSGRGRIGSEIVPSAIAALSESSGNAGNLNITANELRIEDGARLSVSGAVGSDALPNPGSAGELRLQVGSVFLNQGRIEAETSAGDGANIAIEGLDVLIAQDNSRISAQAFSTADGGNITIDSRNGFVIATNNSNSDIVANAFEGQGGQIRIRAQSIIGLEPRDSQPNPNGTNDIDASSRFGAPGVIRLETPDVEPERGTFELANTLIDTPPLDAVCGPRPDSQSRFALIGRGGLPTAPTDALMGSPPSVSWVTREPNAIGSLVGDPSSPFPMANNGIERWSDRPQHDISPHTPSPPDTSSRTITEAQQWQVTENGEVELLAAPSSMPVRQPSTTLSPSCLSDHT